MARKELTVVAAVSILASAFGSATSAALFALSPLAAANSMGLTPAPIAAMDAISSGALLLNTAATEGLGYEVCSFLDTTQGLSQGSSSLQSLFNPGADLDLTTTTDFEDLAAPAADIVEFTDQDRALAADYVSSAVLWNGVVGGLLGATLYAVLSPDLWRAIF